MGAIAQIAVYPSASDEVGPDDVPHILDFEPKNRDLYETATQSKEFLSATSENVSVQKGTTNLEDTEKSAKAGIRGGVPIPGIDGFLGASVEVAITKSRDTATVDTRTTDTSRKDRETKSFTTTFSQMYQLFKGYHLGTNRSVFTIAPRPHIVNNPDLADFNLLMERGRSKESTR